MMTIWYHTIRQPIERPRDHI